MFYLKDLRLFMVKQTKSGGVKNTVDCTDLKEQMG